MTTKLAESIRKCEHYTSLRQPQRVMNPKKWDKALNRFFSDVFALIKKFERCETLAQSEFQAVLRRIDKIAKNSIDPKQVLRAKEMLEEAYNSRGFRYPPDELGFPEPSLFPRLTSWRNCFVWGLYAEGMLGLNPAPIPRAFSGDVPPSTASSEPIVEGDVKANSFGERVVYNYFIPALRHTAQWVRSMFTTSMPAVPSVEPHNSTQPVDRNPENCDSFSSEGGLPHHVEMCHLCQSHFTEVKESSPELNQADQKTQSVVFNADPLRTVQPKDPPQLRRFIETPIDNLVANDKIFQHVLGGSFGKGTGLEGNQALMTTAYTARLIEHMHQTHFAEAFDGHRPETDSQSDVLRDYSKKMPIALCLQNAFETESFETFYDLLLCEMSRLKKGESLSFQAGWVDKTALGHSDSGGHAIVVNMIKQENGLYTFSVNNLGAGIEFHTSAIIDGKIKTLSFTNIVDIQEENLLSPTFWKTLQELRHPSPYGDDWKPSDLYQNILHILKGRVSRHQYSLDQMHEIVEAGHCTFSSWTALLKQHLDQTGLYPRFEYGFQFKTLYEYFRQNRNRLNEEAVRKLLKKGLEDFARISRSLIQSNALSPSDAAYTVEQISIISSAIAQAEEAHLQKIRQSIPALSFESKPEREEFPVSLPKPIVWNSTTLSMPAEPIQPVLPYRSETFHGDLIHFHEEALQLNNDAHFHLAFHHIQRFIRQIPIDWMEKPIAEWSRLDTPWQHMTQKQAEETVKTLAKLSEQFIYSIWKCPEMRQVESTEYLTQLKILTLIDAISRGALNISIPSLYQSTFDMLLKHSSSQLMMTDPIWSRQCLAINAYWETADPEKLRDERDHISFFNFEEFPALSMRTGDEHYEAELCSEDLSNNRGWEYVRRRIILQNHDKQPECPKPPESFRWLLNHLQSPEIQAKIRSDYPEAAALDPMSQAIYFAYAQKNGSSDRFSYISEERNSAIIPPSFFAIRSVSYLTNFFIHSQPDFQIRKEPQIRDYRDRLWYHPSESLQFRAVPHEKNQGILSPYWIEHVNHFGESHRLYDLNNPHQFDQMVDIRFSKHDRSHIKDQLKKISKYRLLLGDRKCLGWSDLYSFYSKIAIKRDLSNPYDDNTPDLGYRHRLDSHMIYALDHDDIKPPLNYQDMRNLLSLSSHPELQIQQTLGFFRQNPNWLDNPQGQSFFKQLMFEPNLLMREFKNQPLKSGNLARQLADFCREHYHFYFNTGGLSNALYFLEMSQLFENHVRAAIVEFPDAFPEQPDFHFLDPKIEFDRLLSLDNLSNNDRAAIQFSRAFGLQGQSRITRDELIHLIVSAIQGNDMPGIEAKSPNDQIFPEIIADFKCRHSEIQALLMRFDQEIRALLESGGGNSILNEILQKIYPQFKKTEWECLGYPRYQSKDKSIILDVVHGTVFIDGGAKRSLPERWRIDPLVGLFCKDRGPVFSAQIGENTWEIFNEKNERYIVIEGNPPILFQKIQDKWHQHIDCSILPLSLQEGLHCWMPMDGSSPIWVGTDQNEYKYSLKQSIDHSPSMVIHQLNRGQETGLILEHLQGHEHPYRLLNRFENPDYIRIWKIKGAATAQSIEMPRYDLHFDIRSIEGEAKAFCVETPGFWIAKNQVVVDLGDIPQYLVLENGAGKKIVFIPNKSMKSPRSSLSTDYALLDEGTPRNPAYFHYDISTSGKLIVPDNGVSSLHLTLLRLSEQEYNAAHAILMDFESQTEPYSPQEINKLIEISLFSQVNHDHDPRAAAIQLRAIYLLIRDGIDLDTHPNLNEPWNHIYYEYRQKNDHIPPHLKLNARQIEILNRKIQNPPSTHFQPQMVAVQPLDFVDFQKDLDISFFLRAITDPSPTEKVSQASLRRSNSLTKNFTEFYSCARSTLNATQAASWLEKMSGLSMQANSPLARWLATFRKKVSNPMPALTEEIRAQLALCILSESDETEKIAATFLFAVLEQPERFPPAEEMAQLIQSSQSDDADRKETATKTLQSHFNTARSCFQNNRPRQSDDPGQKDLPHKKPPTVATRPSTSFSPPPDVCVSVAGSSSDPAKAAPFFEFLIAEKKAGKSEEARRTLADHFALSPRDQQMQRKFERLHQSLQEYQPPALFSYKLKDGIDLSSWRSSLLNDTDAMDRSLESRSQELLALANLMPSSKEEISTRHLEYFSGDRISMELDDLIVLFSSLDAEQFLRINPSLSLEEVQQLYQKTSEYLAQATALRQQKTIARLIQSVQKAEQEGNEEQKALAMEELGQEVQKTRQYNIAEHPDWLVFEYYKQFLLRKDQVESLDKLKTKGLGLEACMGSGKTDVLALLSLLADADGVHVPIFMMPTDLMPSMSPKFKKKLGLFYHRLIDVIPIERNQNLDAASIEQLLQRLKDAQEKRKIILMTGASVKNLFLNWIEKMDIAASPSTIDHSQIERELDLLNQVFEIFWQSPLTIDEADLEMDVIKTHHFTYGSPKHLKEETMNTVASFHHLLATNPRVRPLLNVGFLPSQTGAPPMTSEYYEQTVRPVLVEEILRGDWSVYDHRLKDFFQKLTGSDRQLAKEYLNNQSEKSALIDRIDSIEIKNALAILKEEISQIFVTTAMKQKGEHFGLLPHGQKTAFPRIPIPYHGSQNPARRSQFANVLAIMNYAMDYYMNTGINPEILSEELEILREKIVKDVKSDIDRKQSPAYIAFVQLCNGLDIPLFHTTSAQIDLMVERINQNESQKIDLIRKHVLSEIRTYPRRLNTNAHILSTLFQSINAFSGTLRWNAETFPDAVTRWDFSDTDVKTLHLLWEKSPHAVAIVPDALLTKPTPDALMDQILDPDHLANGISVADAGGIFRSWTNEQNARALLEHHTRSGHSFIKGVTYYDEDDHEFVIEQGKPQPILRSSTDLKFDELAVYWDQKHTTGSDQRLSPQMHCVLTVSRYTTLRGISQSAWRLRQLDRGQIPSFAIAKEHAEVVQTRLHSEWPSDPSPIDLKDILVYAYYIEAERQGTDNFRALKQKMQSVLIDPLVRKILRDPQIPWVQRYQVFNETRDLFISEEPQDLSLVFGDPSILTNSSKVVDATVQQIIQSRAFKAFEALPCVKKHVDVPQLRQSLQKIIRDEISGLPDRLPMNAPSGSDEIVEVEDLTEQHNEEETHQEIHQETHQETHKETEKEARSLKGDEAPYPIFIHDRKGLFQKSYFTPRFDPLLTIETTKTPEGTLISPPQTLFFRMSDMLRSQNPASSQEKDLGFSPSILTTINLFPAYRLSGPSDIPLPPSFEPFGPNQQTGEHLLVIQDRKDPTQIQVIMIDLEDAAIFEKFLVEDHDSQTAELREVNLCLYHLNNGMFRTSREGFDEQKLEQNPQFQLMKVQAKFLNGELSYTPNEQATLQHWITRTNADKLDEFFKNQILEWKPGSRAAFERSDIARVLRRFK